jgi:hypothetical protein
MTALAAVVSLALALVGSPEGALRLERTTALQRSAEQVWPEPSRANGDRSQAYEDGCLVASRARRSPPCVYGDPGAAVTVVLFGDSHANQFFPALEPIARARHWRLVALMKGGCPPPPGTLRDPRTLGWQNRACRIWRAWALRRIARERPALIVTSGSNGSRLWRGGVRLAHAASDRAVARAYARTARRLARIAPRVVAIRDTPRPTLDVGGCVAAHMRDLRRCAFARPRRAGQPDPISRALESVDGVTVLDPLPELCPRSLCPAVIGDALVWRALAHVTGTYSGTMSRWLARQLPSLR